MEHKIRPNKLLGQNFLTDKSVLKKIIETADLSPTDTVLEIGPGTGILTKELAQKAKRVIAVEKDPKMVEILREESKGFGNIEIIQGDILKKIKNNELEIKGYKVVANIPYYLTTNLIRNLLENKNPPKEMVLMLQKEVAERICANPPDMNLLAVAVQFYATAKIIKYVSKKSFWPVPKVDSAIIKITPLIYADSRPIRADRKRIDTDKFFRIVKAGFSQPRKQLLNNLSRLNFLSKNYSGQAKSLKNNKEIIKKWLSRNKINPSQRAETLGIKDWLNLCNNF